MTALFTFDGVVVEYDGARILDVAHADVPDRGVTCVVGPSGAGKSTLLRLCNRLEVPFEGIVRFRGEDVADVDPLWLRRRVGMVFQRPVLFGGSVRDNLAVAAPDADDRTFVEALERADLDRGFLDRAADELSGGEAQRACLARTLVVEPEVLLMDEPTSALDAAPQRALEDLACQLARSGVPALWVTHDLEQAERVGDHVLVLLDGRVTAQGTLASVRDDPGPATAAFLRGERTRKGDEGVGDDA